MKDRAYLLDLIDLQQRAKGKGEEIENAVKIAGTVQKGSVTIRNMNGYRSVEKQRLLIKHEEKMSHFTHSVLFQMMADGRSIPGSVEPTVT